MKVLDSVITTCEELELWAGTLEHQLGDPASRVCLLFFPWSDLQFFYGTDAQMAARWKQDERTVELAFFTPPKIGVPADSTLAMNVINMPVSVDGPELTEAGEIDRFHIKQVCPGVWTMSPSLNMRGVLHGFVVLYGVPDPAPWQSRIVLAKAF